MGQGHFYFLFIQSVFFLQNDACSVNGVAGNWWVTRVLDDPDATVLATVAQNGRGLIGDVKLRPDVRIVTVTRHNRDDVPATVAMLLRRSLNRSLEQTADGL